MRGITNFDLKKKMIWKCTANDSIELKMMEQSKMVHPRKWFIHDTAYEQSVAPLHIYLLLNQSAVNL